MKNRIWKLSVLMAAVCLLSGCGPVSSKTAAGTAAADRQRLTEAVSAENVSTENISAENETAAACETGEEASLWADVTLTGGSGKIKVASPAEIRSNADGTYTAVICWSSPNYDYMIVNGVTCYPVNTEGNSVFEIPVPSPDCVLEVEADTTAMSQPHLIHYTLAFGADAGQTSSAEAETASEKQADAEPLTGITYTGSLELSYAEEFSADFYEGELTLITIGEGSRFLLVPEGKTAPENLPDDITLLCQPLENIYLVSSGMMDMFAACDAMDSLHFCALEEKSWYVDAAVKAMEDKTLIYAGKYSAPDYELLAAGACDLAIENTMVLHSPEVVEELENLGIPVLTERSSYEKTPQGRMEWVRLCGLLTGHLEEADQVFEKQLSAFQALENEENTQKTAAFFYVTTSGMVSVRNASDYIPEMIVLAGGNYAFPELGLDSANATSTLQMEEFYAQAKDADYLIYNSTIAGEIESLQDFLALSPLFSDMKAVQENHVYCTNRNLYQSSMELGEIAAELHAILTDQAADLTYFYRLD